MRDLLTGVDTTEPSDGTFVLIGAHPHTEWLPDALLRDERGYVLTGQEILAEGGRLAWRYDGAPQPLETSVRGVFAVGDVRIGVGQAGRLRGR